MCDGQPQIRQFLYITPEYSPHRLAAATTYCTVGEAYHLYKSTRQENLTPGSVEKPEANGLFSFLRDHDTHTYTHTATHRHLGSRSCLGK